MIHKHYIKKDPSKWFINIMLNTILQNWFINITLNRILQKFIQSYPYFGSDNIPSFNL